MANRQVDPSQLQGKDLDRWYQRTPQEIERQKRAEDQQEYLKFVASIQADEHAGLNDLQAPLDEVGDAFRKWQNGPKIQRPNVAESFIPVVGPVWEAVADVQDGNYAGAAFNGAMAVADVLPIGVAAKGVKAATKGVTVLKKGSVTAEAARKALKRRGVVNPGEEIHHSIPLNGTRRNVQDWRNHYAFLKVLPKEQHRRLTGSWMGAPRYDPIRRAWIGTTDWMKAVPAGVAGYAADAWENFEQPFEGQSAAPNARSTR